ncbi:hypothetical protein TNCV_730251 [Trichonephila clavipes]|nr:hypothetical protein TNCV_730251 [Trichonephila clavipes]
MSYSFDDSGRGGCGHTSRSRNVMGCNSGATQVPLCRGSVQLGHRLRPLIENVWKKKLSLQEALDLLQNLPSEISDVPTDDFSDEEFPANNLLEFSLDF